MQLGIDLHRVFKELCEPLQVHLRSEHQLLVALRAVPEEQLELVLEEARQRALACIAHDAAKLRLLGRELGRGGFGRAILFGHYRADAALAFQRCGVFRRFGRLEIARVLRVKFALRNRTLGRAPVDLDRLAIAQEAIVVQAELPGLGAVERRGRDHLSVERNNEAHVGQRPLLAQRGMEPVGQFLRFDLTEQKLDLRVECLLLLRDGFRHSAGHIVGHALVKEGLLALGHQLLVAQGTQRQPRQRQARRHDRQHEDERDLSHGLY